MPNILIEEKGKYGIDCTEAVWATDEVHKLYHQSKLSRLCDTDFLIETEDHIFLVEYKNANVPEALAHVKVDDEYNPFNEKKFDTLIRKYYDTLHYLRLRNKMKTTKYIFVVEYPKGDSTSRKLLRNRMKKQLPFRLQTDMGVLEPLIDEVAVVNIQEWNDNPIYGIYPIKPVTSGGT